MDIRNIKDKEEAISYLRNANWVIENRFNKTIDTDTVRLFVNNVIVWLEKQEIKEEE